MEPNLKRNFNPFFLKIVLPVVLAISLYIISLFSVLLPSFESNMLDNKREMIRELTNSAWSLIDEYYQESLNGKITKEEAQKEAIARIKGLRFGEDNKDYFWLTDMQPVMLVHPYRPDLNGTDLSEFQDPNGKKLFLEFVKVCKEQEAGYVDYEWQWKNDSTRIVPKLSYVKAFRPWNWIIGTGIYIEDVRDEIIALEARLINISLLIIAAIILILLFIILQSLRIEKRRLKAETLLKKSKEQYQKLVEASTEGFMMMLKGNFIFANKVLLGKIGYSEEEFSKLYLNDLFPKEDIENPDGIQFFKPIIEGKAESTKQLTMLKRKNMAPIEVEITTSKVSVDGESGFILLVSDVDRNKQELLQSQTRYQSLTYNLEMGVFRATLGRKGRFVEANPATLRILGFDNMNELSEISVFDLFQDKAGRNVALKELLTRGSVKNRVFRLKKSDGRVISIGLSAVLTNDENGEAAYCDGVIEDITEQQILLERQEDLMVELQTSLLFLNQPIVHFVRKTDYCSHILSISEAARIMTKNNISALLINIDDNTTTGIITDHDIRSRVVAGNENVNDPVYKIMSAPLISISENSLVFEAILKMQEKNIRHLAVKNLSGKITSVVSFEELMQAQTYSLSIIIHEIEHAVDVSAIVEVHEKMPQLINTLINSGANTQNITRIITAVTDSVTRKLIEFAIKELGEPPVKFAFVVLGSEGREEQTLATDQDNAIIYEQTQNEEHIKYFKNLGEKVCNWLNDVGYHFCEGDIMAKNTKWCQPFPVWKKYFSDWILQPESKNLLNINIFFDYRLVYGEADFVDALTDFIHNEVTKTDMFYYLFAGNTLQFKSPIDFFGNIRTTTSTHNEDVFSIKESIVPLVSFARIYGLKNEIVETNTLGRMKQLVNGKFISEELYEEFVVAYNFLMLMRFTHQIELINKGKDADNFIVLKRLTGIEQTMLKKVFNQIAEFQKNIAINFTGKTL